MVRALQGGFGGQGLTLLHPQVSRLPPGWRSLGQALPVRVGQEPVSFRDQLVS